MTMALAHRGPDATNAWVDETAGIAFGHRRLSVLDLSAAGAQPMHSDCGRFTVTLNGEIYNHLELRAELEAMNGASNWRGHSDTETLLAGIEACLAERDEPDQDARPGRRRPDDAAAERAERLIARHPEPKAKDPCVPRRGKPSSARRGPSLLCSSG